MRRKRKFLNLLMVAAIVLITFAGFMIVGNIKGWFGNETSALAVVEKKTGGANIERSGVSYALEEGNVLREGDIVQTLNGASIDISLDKGTVGLNENSETAFRVSEDGSGIIKMNSGEAFVTTDGAFRMFVNETEIWTEKSTFSVSAQYGSITISVFENEISVDGEIIEEGQMASILTDGLHQEELLAQSLNEFSLSKVRETLKKRELCFNEKVLDELEAERKAAEEEALEAKFLEEKETEEIEAQREKNKESMQGNRNHASSEAGGNAGNGSTESDDSRNTCTISIRCDTILKNMDNLASGKNKYVPSNGVILATSKISFSEGDTVFDVLKKACSLAGIQLEYAWTPMYNSYYVEGINHLYEFDCGGQSGWMYKVNGWFPNYGCSSYTVEAGDSIVWCYTCNGLGKDVK